MDALAKKYKKPYDAEYRRAQYEKHKAAIIAHQKEYDEAHKAERTLYHRNRYRRLHGLPEVRE